MHSLLKAAAFLATLTLSGAVVAQATDAVGEDFIKAVELDERDAPNTRGFSLGRPETRSAQPARQQSARQQPVRQTSARKGVNMELNFNYNSAELTPAAQLRAKSIARALNDKRLAAMRFRIEGHTDASGSAGYNMALSERRAQTVANFLVNEGVSRDRLDVQGFGFQHLLNGVSPTSGRNRRVQAVRVS